MKGVKALAPVGMTWLQAPDSKPLQRSKANAGIAFLEVPHQQPRRQSKDLTGKSKVTDWDLRRPEVLFNDHTDTLMKFEYKRGMIINAPLHEPMCPRGQARPLAHYESISAWGNVFTKPRYLIVIALHETEYTCIPLYSHNGEGLRGKERYRNEFISVRDERRIASDFRAHSDHEPLVCKILKDRVLDADTTAWLTHPVARSYDLNLSVCGQLDEASLKRLVELMMLKMREGMGLA